MFINRHHMKKGEATMEQTLRYIKEKEVSEITGLSVQTLRNYRLTGRGPSYRKIGVAVRYRLADIISFMENGTVVPHNNYMAEER
jgi:predicted DNA-binding transcriptional regulator AlpA